MRVNRGHAVHAAHHPQPDGRNVRRNMRHVRAHVRGALEPQAEDAGIFVECELAAHFDVASVTIGEEGFDAHGPFPTDSLMVRARQGEFDAVVAMYHDQGHIALKLLGMHQAVNITLGLPIVRTSVAHGTAFDLAWQGRANSNSMLEAVRVASRLTGVARMSQAHPSKPEA